jgi:hypothetical protein
METHVLPRKKLPIGIQTLAKLHEEGCYYVDKTPLALQLIQQGNAYFLSRPRRFGKSLFLDTLKELFEGNQALFTGLHAEQHWDWAVKYPVLRLSFGGGVLKSPQALEAVIHEQFSGYEEGVGLEVRFPDIPSRFKRLIQGLHRHYGQRVVVLVDEYDKPILDNLNEPDLARQMRDALRDLYSVLKDQDAYLKFVFITGVSKFSKVSLFSGLNNLQDITLDARYSALCGYTEQDLDTVFGPELGAIDRAAVRRWYNGYNWLGEAVYNPFDLLLFFEHNTFKSYWFETGTPTFLIDLLREHNYFTPDLSRLHTDDDLISSFDVDYIAPEALLWQTGYLTFHSREEVSGIPFYTLGYPNREVEVSLNVSLLTAWGVPHRAAIKVRRHLPALLAQADTEGMYHHFKTLFASIPHDWYRNNPLAQYEGYYASVFYSQLAALGLNVQPEDTTNHGRIDLSLQFPHRIYLFEFKVVDQAAEGKALQQLIDKGYADKYRRSESQGERPVTLIGIEFSKAERNIAGWETLTL